MDREDMLALYWCIEDRSPSPGLESDWKAVVEEAEGGGETGRVSEARELLSLVVVVVPCVWEVGEDCSSGSFSPGASPPSWEGRKVVRSSSVEKGMSREGCWESEGVTSEREE